MEYHQQLELWRGNVAGVIQMARERNEISDWIVAMAPLASYELWELVSAEYAEMLEEEGSYHKAVTYLLASNKVHQAIDLFRRHRLFKEAIKLTRLRLSSVDPLLEDLYTEWGQNLMKDGQFEQAAQCYLAMRHIQEAEIVNNRLRHKLGTPLYTPTLLANENQQGLVYSYTIFSQQLESAQWHEAYKFIQEHTFLKVLLPLLTTHQLLIQQLTNLIQGLTLTNRPMTPENLSELEKREIPSGKTEFPEFLVDKSDIDPVVPWEPFLIANHTFPHHLLKMWHQHLNVTMATQELKVMYASMSHLVSRRQNTKNLTSTLVLISMDLTLCLLALLMSETSSAITHFLQAISTLHQSGHFIVMQGICRLMLPQGPKYLLKLQQEFTACRVLITMESHGDVNITSGENHNSIKKFLTDIKDDSAISMPSLRCRELDCLRAYYYLAVLDFLNDKLLCAQNENDSHDGMPNKKVIVNEQDNVKDCVCHKSSSNGEASKNKMNINSLLDNINSHQDFICSETPKANIKARNCDIKDSNCKWKTTNYPQNGKTLLTADCSTLSQNSLQTLAGSFYSTILACGHPNKDNDKNLSCNDCLKMNVTQKEDTNEKLDNNFIHYCYGSSLPKASVIDCKVSIHVPNEHNISLSTSSSPEEHVSLPVLGKSSLDSSSFDQLLVPSEGTMLKMSSLRNAADENNTLNIKSSLSTSYSWPTYSSLFSSPSISPLTIHQSSISSSALSASSYSTSTLSSLNSPSAKPSSSDFLTSLSPSLILPSAISPSSNSTLPSSHPLCPSFLSSSLSSTSKSKSSSLSSSNCPALSPTRNKSSEKAQDYIIKTNTFSCNVRNATITTSKGHLNYSNLLRLSKGILWDIQAKREALTETLGYIHHAISLHLLKKYSTGNTHDTSLTDACTETKKQSLATINELEEDGGFNNTLFTTSSMLPEVPLDNVRNKTSAITNIGSRSRTFNSSNMEPTRLPFLQQVIQNTDSIQQSTMNNFAENILPYKGQSSRSEHSTLIHHEHEPEFFKKSRKVLWMDGKETSTNVGVVNMSACQMSRHTPDGSVIPVEWDDLPVDIKYSLPYVTLSLLKQEQESISQELKRVPNMSKIPFPGAQASIRSLLHTSLMSTHISAQEKRIYFKQLSDWATLFSVTSSQQLETEAMFSKAQKEYLMER